LVAPFYRRFVKKILYVKNPGITPGIFNKANAKSHEKALASERGIFRRIVLDNRKTKLLSSTNIILHVTVPFVNSYSINKS